MRFGLLAASAVLLLIFGCVAQHGAEDAPAKLAQAPEKQSDASGAAPSSDAGGQATGQTMPAPAEPSPAPAAAPSPGGRTADYATYQLYVPASVNALNDSIVIAAFSPSGDAGSMIGAWQAAADKRGWPIFASKTFHNGADLPLAFSNDTFADMGNAAASLKYANPKFVFTGFSGGGQVSHAFAFGSPGKVAAVVTNCGIINRGFLNYTQYYPRNKTVLFIASPADFRYAEMQQDKAYLEALGWKTGWLEFAGGHAIAPPETYEQAAGWLERNT